MMEPINRESNHNAEPGKMVDDTVSRQDAIDELDEQIEYCNKALSSFDISAKDKYAVEAERASLKAYREQLENLPSAQPEIIRCKDCKHWLTRNGGYCEIWEQYISNDAFYCGCGARIEE